MPIVEKAMADFLLRIAVNSSYVVLGMHDIISESFYKHSLGDFLDGLPKHLSFATQFSPYLKPYVSNKFSKVVFSDIHELLIGSFYRYYKIRLPVLAYHGRFYDWPNSVGVSEENLKRIAAHSVALFEAYFPRAAQRLIGKGPEDRESIFFQFAHGMHMANTHDLDKDEMKAFLYESEHVWDDVVEYLPKIKENWNIFSFLQAVFRDNFSRFWAGYRADYMETILAWTMAGAFEGHNMGLIKAFWEDLERRLERHEFLIRTAEVY
jgi:hypothetical protein